MAPRFNVSRAEQEQKVRCPYLLWFLTMSTTTTTLSMFHSALELIEYPTAHRMALTQCPPTVLQHEAPPQWFLRFTAGNPWSAAERYARYWDYRLELFGERAYWPLLGSNDDAPSALTEDDMRVLASGQSMIAPADRHGRTVLIWEDARLEPDMVDTSAKLRSLFYLLTKALQENTSARAHEMAMLCPLVQSYSAPLDWLLPRLFFGRLLEVLPVMADEVHLLAPEPLWFSGHLMVSVTLQGIALFLGPDLAGIVNVHLGALVERPQGIRLIGAFQEALKEFGFTTKSLPSCVDGKMTKEFHDTWLKRLCREELKMYLTEDDLRRRQQELDKQHSRTKRQRRFNAVADLQAQKRQLQEEQVQLQTEYTKLTATLAKAQQKSRELGLNLVPSSQKVSIASSQPTNGSQLQKPATNGPAGPEKPVKPAANQNILYYVMQEMFSFLSIGRKPELKPLGPVSPLANHFASSSSAASSSSPSDIHSRAQHSHANHHPDPCLEPLALQSSSPDLADARDDGYPDALHRLFSAMAEEVSEEPGALEPVPLAEVFPSTG